MPIFRVFSRAARIFGLTIIVRRQSFLLMVPGVSEAEEALMEVPLR